MSYEIVIMPRARRMIAEARDWWNAHRPQAAALLGDELDRAFQRLSDNPQLGAAWPHRDGVRRLVLVRVGFLVLYRVRPRTQRIEVVSLWHGARGQRPEL